MPDANQWDVVNEGDDLLLPLYKALERHAIQKATNFRIDDTGSKVIALQKQIAAEIAALQLLGESTKVVRTGINATGLYWETPNGPVVLFYTGRHHAGEIVDQLLRQRLLSSPKLVKCTDGASKNFDHEYGDKLVESTCNAHAFLKFRDIRDKYPAEYAQAGSVYKQVFDHDDQAKALGLTAVDRMLYHRQHSRPLMEELKEKCEEKINSKLVEPNSPLWEPLTFVVNQWNRLIRFCEVPDVPLDTNLVNAARGIHEVMPTAGLCRVRQSEELYGAESAGAARLTVGIIRGRRGTRAVGPRSGTGEVWFRARLRAREPSP
jgi:hypothetical protein